MKKVAVVILKVLGWIIFSVLLLFISAILALRLPSVQTYVIHKATSFVSSKTHTRVEIGEIKIIFPRSVSISKVYAEDLKKDTLVYMGNLDVKINLFSLLHKEINISRTEIKDLHANVYRPASDSSFNFQFIINAFAPAKKTKEITEVASIKDTTKSAPWTFNVGEVGLEDIDLSFNDSLGGSLFFCKLETLELDVDELDIEKMRFGVNSLQVKNGTSGFEILKSSPPSTTTGKTIPLNIIAAKMEMENIAFRFTNKPGLQDMKFKIGKSQIKNSSFDLPTLSIRVGRFDLASSKVDISMVVDTTSAPGPENMVAESDSLPSPVNVDAEYINLQNNYVKIDLNRSAPKDTGIDFQHLEVSNVSLKATKSHYSYQNIKATVESLSANERSGLQIKHFASKVVMDTKHAEAKNLYLETNLSKISRYASVGFRSWDDLSKNIGGLKIKADLHESIVDLRDVLQFQPDLVKIDIIRKNLKQPIKIDGLVQGKLSDISIEKLVLSIGKSTHIEASGHITGLPEINTTKFDIMLSSLNTSHEDINTFLPITVLSAFQLPDSIVAHGSFIGTVTDFDASINTHTSDGNLQGEVSIRDLSKVPSYKAKLITHSMDVGKILKQKPLIGKVTLDAKVEGKGFTEEDLDVMIDAKIDSAFLNKYTYTKLNIKGHVKDKLFSGHIDESDPNLYFTFDGKVDMNKEVNEYSFLLDIQGADLQALHLTTNDIRLSAVADANIKAPAFDRMNGNAGIKNIVLYSQGKKYEVDSLLFVTFNDDKRNSFEVNSTILKAKFDGNIALGALPATLSNHFNYYFKTGKNKPGKPEHFDLEVDINNSPLIYEVLIPDLKDFVPGKIKGSFDSETHKLDFDADMVHINYAGNEISNLDISIHSDKQALNYSAGVDQFSNSQIVLEKTALSGIVKNDVAGVNLSIVKNSKDRKKKTVNNNKLNISSQIVSKEDGVYRFNILPKGFVINDEDWSVPEGNIVEFGKNGVYVHEMELQKDEQKISVNSTEKSMKADMDVVFKNFELLTLSQIVEKDEPIARGKLDGKVVFKDYHKEMAFVSDLNIENAQFKNSTIGNISIKADNLTEHKYTLSAAITGNENDIMLKGYLQGHAKGMLMDLDLKLNKLNLTSFQGFISEEAKSVSGSAFGDLKVTGETSSPKVNGSITLHNAAGQVYMLNQYLKIEDSKISIDPDGIYFPNVVIHDTENNTATIKGKIGMTEFKDFKYNIDVVTDKFTIMNSTRKNNKMLNGKMTISSRIKIRGNDSKPDIQARVKVEDGSKVCFTVPENQLNADKGEGVVEFTIDTIKLNPIILKAALQKKTTSEIKGINISSDLEINRRSTLKLVLDPTQTDTLVVAGDAHLSFALDESGKISLAGTYVVSNGSYELSLEDIVNKKFFINKGSTITWNGDPLDALLDITAQYNVRTSPADLLASGSSGKVGVDPSAARNALNFYVKIYIKGPLLKPNLKFGLEMDPTQQQALGGTVYAKISSLSVNESELDKQVFSLLVLGSFMPTSNSSGGGTDYSGIARSSASSILSSQLNALSAQYVKGVELNFDLQSYNDYASGQKSGNTQLAVGVKKRFLDDRLSVQIGSNIGLEGQQKASQNNVSNLTGNMVVEYSLTKDGNYRLKAFRQNQYEGLIYGVVIKTGAGIIYSRDYNSFSELFKPRDKKK